jgi:hypothetical protein
MIEIVVLADFLNSFFEAFHPLHYVTAVFRPVSFQAEPVLLESAQEGRFDGSEIFIQH